MKKDKKSKIKAKKMPNPGTKEALALGCKCPVLDNAHGKGYYGREGVFVYNMACKIHAKEIGRDSL